MGEVIQLPSSAINLTKNNSKAETITVSASGLNTVVFSKKLPVSVGGAYQIVAFDKDGIGLDFSATVKTIEGFTYSTLTTGDWVYLVVPTI